MVVATGIPNGVLNLHSGLRAAAALEQTFVKIIHLELLAADVGLM